MPDKCDLCWEEVPSAEIRRCNFCNNRVCDECSRTISEQKQQGSVVNASVDRVQCANCEFGGN